MEVVCAELARQPRISASAQGWVPWLKGTLTAPPSGAMCWRGFEGARSNAAAVNSLGGLVGWENLAGAGGHCGQV